MNPPINSPILKMKISVPGLREHLVPRDRLLHNMTAGQQGHLTTVIAPAGYGKSTLLAQWAHAVSERCAWMSLDERDNDPVRFWRYVTASIASVLPEQQGERLMNHTQLLPGVSITAYLDTLISDLYEWSETLHLILEDLHSIYYTPIHEGLSYLIDYLPGHIHLLISSRTDLPFSTVKRWADHKINHIGTDQLQFTSDETKRFFRHATDSSYPKPNSMQLQTLLDRTEGWITGLQLVALSLRSGSRLEPFMEEIKGDQFHVSSYLFQEVVGKLPSEVFRFLLQTAVLSRLNVQVCDAVTDSDNSRSMLEELRKQNLFLVPLDEQHTWFRYHHLFSQFLQDLLQRECDGEYVKRHRLAGQYYASIGSTDEAIDHMFAAQDIESAVGLLEQHAQTVLERGELTTLQQWFDRVPTSFPVTLETSLLHTFVVVLMGDLERSGRMLANIEEACSNLPSSSRREQLRSSMLFVRSNLVFLNGDFAEWFAFSEGILDNLTPDNPIYYQFDYNRQEPYVRRTSLGMKGALSADTERIAHLFTGVLEAHGWDHSLMNLYVKMSLCEGYYEWNRLAECRQLLMQLRKAPPSQKTMGLFIPLHITEARLYAAEGKLHLAHHVLDEAWDAASCRKESSWLSSLRTVRSLIYVREGRITDARKELAVLPISIKDRPTYSREPEYLALVRLLGKQRKETEALHLLELLKPQAERELQISSIMEITCLQALLEYQRGQRKQSLQLLREALRLGAQNGYVRTFLDEGEDMYQLLMRYTSHPAQEEDVDMGLIQTHHYARMLMEYFPNHVKADTPHITSSQSALPEQLNRNEKNLLRLILQGAANKQMAAALGLSEGTIRVYLSRLYDKLGVTSRTQALVRAQSLNLLDD
ncbi:LuxR family maltose regulon positive regulatory protein [Paenibacillus sp. LBL]|uniref:LuxR C-terminal-related transcriptional regulator n=1 Tax=Paenibacillus sp. LBL TaxID=2940563 RepID=UPI0024750077|nr:LuxR C-terminal-related transcriptional regulator [Paenibacillus sp. LBL]MDH6672638.1 LuxR family maltose regulon positive regulatory protein [Paenibacillus sp. LBL]